jgi:hypothetical protein
MHAQLSFEHCRRLTGAAPALHRDAGCSFSLRNHWRLAVHLNRALSDWVRKLHHATRVFPEGYIFVPGQRNAFYMLLGLWPSFVPTTELYRVLPVAAPNAKSALHLVTLGRNLSRSV